jgi:riboflavin biosynthesis pyrimidine reductase
MAIGQPAGARDHRDRRAWCEPLREPLLLPGLATRIGRVGLVAHRPGADEAAARSALASTPAGPGIRWIVTGDDTLDWRGALDGLAALGLPRISCEGGPGINGALLEAGLIDEVFLTLAPALVGGEGLRLTSTRGPARRTELTLVSALTHGSELLLRYRRDTSADAAASR